MKNFYELTTQEKDKYRDEFNKLKYTKDINKVRGTSLFVGLISAILAGLFSSLIDDGLNVQNWLEFTETILTISSIVFIILEINISISFMRWLKIKHNVEY